MKSGMRGLRILIAEHFEVVHRGLRSLLEEHPHWEICGVATTGAETIEKARVLRPDLLLLDVAMPDLDVAAIITQVIRVCPTVKIVALATEDVPKSAANALVAGANGLVLKSEPASDLILTIKNMEKCQPFLSPGVVTMIRSQLERPAAPAPSPRDLSPREFEIFGSLARGVSNKELAGELGISVKTVNAHRSNIMQKLKLRNNSELIQFAIRHRIVEIRG
jgi:DNA-binding NarL/FixJ family response regulator